MANFLEELFASLPNSWQPVANMCDALSHVLYSAYAEHNGHVCQIAGGSCVVAREAWQSGEVLKKGFER